MKLDAQFVAAMVNSHGSFVKMQRHGSDAPPPGPHKKTNGRMSMKFHARLRKEDQVSLCGVPARPDTWLFLPDGFRQHYAHDMRCRRCAAILKMTLTEDGSPESWKPD